MMTNKEKKAVIQGYIAAYNSFDIDGMIALVHPAVEFKNVADGKVNAVALGVEEFRRLATLSKSLFSSRQQRITGFTFTRGGATVGITYEGVLAVDLPNGMRCGETLRLNGRSEFEFKESRIYRISDFS